MSTKHLMSARWPRPACSLRIWSRASTEDRPIENGHDTDKEPPQPPPDDHDEGWWTSLEVSLDQHDKEPPQTSAEPPQTAPERAQSSIIDPTKWTAPAPLREWLVQDWIPIGYATGLYGDGGLGKSLLGQQLLTATACSLPWLNMIVKGGRAVGVMCVDDPDELHRRQESVNALAGVEMCHLEMLRYSSRVGADNLLMTFNERNQGSYTGLFQQLVRFLRGFPPRVVFLDTLADIFGGDEIKRAQARQFVQGVCGNIAREFACAVVVSAHPSAVGISTGSGTSGTTAWNNTFRSRLYLSSPKDKPGERTLARMKANYAPKDAEIALEWRNGAFVARGSPPPAQTLPWTDIDAIFTAIEDAWADGKPYSNQPQTKKFGRYLPLWVEMTMGHQQTKIAKLLDGWLAAGFLAVGIASAHSKTYGLRVVRRLRKNAAEVAPETSAETSAAEVDENERSSEN